MTCESKLSVVLSDAPADALADGLGLDRPRRKIRESMNNSIHIRDLAFGACQFALERNKPTGDLQKPQ